MTRLILLFLLPALCCFQAFEALAQDDVRKKNSTVEAPAREDIRPAAGAIRGQIFDAETGEPMPQAMIIIPELKGVGAFSDMDGNYSIENVPPGAYTIKVTYVTFSDLIVEDVSVTAGGVEVVNLKMEPETNETTEIVVTSKQVKNTEAALLTMQRVAAVTLDGISSEQTRRNGDSDAASSLRRVTGVTVEDGRYVYVRGLGDRYNKTLVNGSQVPGLDPSRNSVQMDLFPTNIIDNVIVYKAFAPNLPGDFTGGLININTKDFPEKFTLYLNTRLAFNDQATFNDNFLLYEGSSTDWFGFDSGARAEPAYSQPLQQVAGAYTPENPIDREVDQVTRRFGGDMYPTRQNNFLDQSHQVSVGDQLKLFGKPLGYIATISYRRRYQYYDNGTEAFYRRVGSSASELNKMYDFRDERGQESVLFGGLFTLSYKISEGHKLTFTYNHNHAGESSARYQEGERVSNAPGQIQQNRVMSYLERALDVVQLRGEHYFKNAGRIKIEWLASLVYMKQDEPDLRFFSNHYEVNPDGSRNYQILIAQYDPPTRFFRNLQENNTDNRLHITIPVRKNVEIKTGGAFSAKLRVPFEERWYRYDGPELSNYNGNPAQYWDPANLGAGEDGLWNLAVYDNSDPANTYDGEESVIAGYVMADAKIVPKLRVVTGVRVERTYSRVESGAPNLPPAVIETNDPLPCLNLIYSPKKNINARLNYGRTVARPIMREMAPYANFDFIGGNLLRGNNELDRTLIDNLDLRFEWFPSYREIISFGLFYKNFNNPIERAIDPLSASNDAFELYYRNVDAAIAYGLEFEIKKNLGFFAPLFAPLFASVAPFEPGERDLAPALSNFQIGVNTSLIRSEVDIEPGELAAIQAANPDAEDTRPLYAQSPYIVNANIGYVNDSTGSSVILNYNVFGPRITEVGYSGAPNVYEQPRNGLDFNYIQKIGQRKRWAIRLAAQNLLNPKYSFEQELLGNVYTVREYTVGRRFILGVSYEIR